MKKDYVIRVNEFYAKRRPEVADHTIEFSFDYDTREVGGRDAMGVRMYLDRIRRAMEKDGTSKHQPGPGVPVVKINWERLDEGMLATLMVDPCGKWDISPIGEVPDDHYDPRVIDLETGEVIGRMIE